MLEDYPLDPPSRTFAARPTHTTLLSADAPRRLLNADMVEIRVILTPLRFWDAPTGERELRPAAEGTVKGAVTIDRYLRIDAKDSRAVFYLLRVLLQNLVREYLGVAV